MKKLLKSLKSYLSITLNLPFLYQKPYFSQEGEDLIIQKLFSHKKNGFYVDIGAHHPFRYSNTYFLYKKGWNGINIDPSLNIKKIFGKTRKRDINLELAIDKKNGKKILYIFEDAALNTLSKTNADEVISSRQSKLIKTISVKTQRLDDILKKYTKKIKQIDLLNVDVEGFEMNVLESSDWAYYRPKVIVIENINKDLKLRNYLIKLNYSLIAQTISSDIYAQK